MTQQFKASYTIHPERDLVRMKLVGDIDAEKLLAFVKALAADPAYRPGMKELADCTECTLQDKFQDMVAYTQVRSSHVPIRKRVRCATILASEEFFAKGRIFAALHAPIGLDVEMFTDTRSALEWLGVPELDV